MFCPPRLQAFSTEFEKFRELNTEILAISVDNEYARI
jgi:alkyl hydroperoxide reductase subunit AhpC